MNAKQSQYIPIMTDSNVALNMAARWDMDEMGIRCIETALRNTGCTSVAVYMVSQNTMLNEYLGDYRCYDLRVNAPLWFATRASVGLILPV